MELIILDGAILNEKERAHDYLKEMLHFPEYYGKNLDALYDCLTELQDVQIKIDVDGKESPYLQRILQVFEEAVEENSRIKVNIV